MLMISIKKFISPFFLLISFLILIYVFYKSEVMWNGELRSYYYQYYFVSLLLVSLSIISFYLGSEIKIKISIIIISISLTLCCIEAFLIIYEKHKEENSIVDTRDRIRIGKAIKSMGYTTKRIRENNMDDKYILGLSIKP